MGPGALFDNCCWYDKWQFSADVYVLHQKLIGCRLKQLKTWINSHTVPYIACINLKSFLKNQLCSFKGNQGRM